MVSRFHILLLAAALALGSLVTAPGSRASAAVTGSTYPTVAAPGTQLTQASQLLSAAQSDADRGDNEAAAEKLRHAAQLEPRSIEIQRLLGDVEYRLQHYQAAEQAYQAVLAVDPGNRDVWNRLGGVYSAEDRYDDAIGAFRKSLPSQAGFANLILAYQDEGRLGDLESEMKIEETRNPYDPSNHYNLASIYKAEQRYDAAISQLQYATDLDARYVDAYNLLGNVYGEQGRYEDAINQYRKAIALDSKYAFAWNNWGVELVNEGQYEASIAKFKQSVELDPGFALGFENMGVAYDHMNDFTQAVEDFQLAINLDPHERNVYVNLGALYYSHNQYNLAEAAFIKGLALQPKSARLHFGLGMTYEAQKKLALAEEQFKIAIAEDPKDSQAASELASVESVLSR
ncbi:MAG: tetratricopeptide repeat protein [Candidatus Eremiobacteraeota bacterium]|nr:tetratricopeptide repeat protein [Candidatus Eremiobacteraeota bacterium]